MDKTSRTCYTIIYVQRAIHDKMAGVQSVPPLPDLPTNNYEPTDSSIGSKLFVGRSVTHTLALERTSNELDARSLLVQAHYSEEDNLSSSPVIYLYQKFRTPPDVHDIHKLLDVV